MSIGNGHPSTLLAYGVRSSTYLHRSHIQSTLLTCLPTYINTEYIYITSAVQELTSKVACLRSTSNEPSILDEKQGKRIGDSEKRENAGTLGRRSARTKPVLNNAPAIIGGGRQQFPLSWQIRRHGLEGEWIPIIPRDLS